MDLKALLNSVKYRAEAGEAPTEGSPAASAPADTGSVDTGTDWAGLVDDGIGDADTDGAAGTDLAAPETPAQPAVPATPAPVAAAEPPVQPQQPPAAQAPAAQPPAAQPAEAPQPAAAPPDLAVLRQNYHNELVQNYQMTPEQVAQFQTEPEVILPVMAANVHLEVLDAISAQLPGRVNAMIENFLKTRETETKAQDEFFTVYPDLKGHRDAVLRVGAMYRAANPTASKEVAIKAIGDFVMQSLGIVSQSAAPQQQAPAPQVNVFQPAQSSGGGAVPMAPSLWDEMIQDD